MKIFEPPNFTLGNHFLANPPAVASTIEVDNTFLPVSEVARLIAFLDNVVKAELLRKQ